MFKVGKLVAELMDVMDVRSSGEMNACEERVTRWCWVW